MITCRVCSEQKDEACFWPHTVKGRLYYDKQCKQCKSNAAKTAYVPRPRPPRKGRQYTNRESMIKFKYGLTENDYTTLLASQGGVCAICRLPPKQSSNGVVKPLCVDHDHATGKVWGLLCGQCNYALGFMKDSTDNLARAIEYLHLHQAAGRKQPFLGN